MIITFASSKGGVGKSTSCSSVAGAMAHSGQRVHVIDLDANHCVSRWLADEKTRPTNLTISAPDPQILTEHLQEAARLYAPDMILIDIAGSFEQALTIAVGRAHLTIIPTSTSEAEIYEAARVARHIQTIFAAFGKIPLYRVLVTRVAPLATYAQQHGFNELDRLKLPRLKTTLAHRTAYLEIGMTGLTPHYAAKERPTAAKAVAELDELMKEIDALLLATYGDQPPAELNTDVAVS
jgi:chromosome partitioning protein